MSTMEKAADRVQAVLDVINELQQENSALLKDKARLDWLADVNNTISNITLPRDIVERNLHSLRDAIDEAMAADNLRRGK